MVVDKIREESQQQINSSEEKVSQLQNELRSQLEVNQTIKHKVYLDSSVFLPLFFSNVAI